MSRRILRHARSQVVGWVALFLVLGGSAVAASGLPANSVGTKQLKNRAVTGVKVAKHTLTGANINFSKLGVVPNSSRLGGVRASGWQRLVRGSCLGKGAIAKVKLNGSVVCQTTITGVRAGAGLTGGGSSGKVLLSLASTYRLPQSCAAGQLAHWTGSAWACTDNLGASSWQLTGNSGINPGQDYLGTSDNKPLILKTHAIQALELQPPGDSAQSNSPNLIGGFSGNSVSSGVSAATIAGGGNTTSPNSVTGDFGTIGGGLGNTAGFHGTVSGGVSNTASGDDATASGDNNVASGPDSTASGGGNTASAFASTAFGSLNTASGANATASGNNNIASGFDSTASGIENTASGQASVALGGNGVASGIASTALGHSDTADGDSSMALGELALVPSGDNDSFVWSDGTLGAGSAQFSATDSNQFDALASHGFNMQVSAPGATYTGCKLTNSNGWACSSDRNVKHAFRPINDQTLLNALARMPIQSWSYKLDPRSTRHIGPTAQDFMAAFHIGANPRLIGTLDEGGVALASVKGVYSLVQTQKATIDHQQARIDQQQSEIDRLQTEVNRLLAQARRH